MKLSIEIIANRLTDGLEYTKEQKEKIIHWLYEFYTANDMSLQGLDDLCWKDSNWVFEQIFG